jgi:hypothetical protein
MNVLSLLSYSLDSFIHSFLLFFNAIWMRVFYYFLKFKIITILLYKTHIHFFLIYLQ